MEGIALNIRWAFQPFLRFVNHKIDYVIMGGGGAQSGVWPQIIADVLNVKVITVKNPRYVTAKGAAMLAAYGLGAVTLNDIKGARQIDRVYEPNKDLRKLYEDKYHVFVKYYRNNEKLMRELNKSIKGP